LIKIIEANLGLDALLPDVEWLERSADIDAACRAYFSCRSRRGCCTVPMVAEGAYGGLLWVM
jgi:hypothetical protein